MASLSWAVMCQRVITDRETNSVSYIDAVEEITLPTTPFPLPPFMVGTTWERETPGEQITARARILDQSGAQLAAIEGRMQSDAKRHRANFAFGGALLPAPGTYVVIVEQLVEEMWRKEAQFSLDIKQLSAEAFAALNADDPDLPSSEGSRKERATSRRNRTRK